MIRADRVRIGQNAGANSQINTVAIGTNAGGNNQIQNAIGIGTQAGISNQQGDAIGIGNNAGSVNQQGRSIAIGYFAGSTSQAASSIAIGNQSGDSSQRSNSIAIGFNAGNLNQGGHAIALGSGAGKTNQHGNTIVLYAGTNSNFDGQNTTATNQIILNASPSQITPFGSNGVYVSSIRSNASTSNSLWYNPSTSEIAYAAAKSFTIDHPIDTTKYLVHGCLEGPEAGVYYRGRAAIGNDHHVTVKLPSYVSHIAVNFSVQLTPIHGSSEALAAFVPLTTSPVSADGQFTVYGRNGSFYWHVYGQRLEMNAEPCKDQVDVRGFGPYTFIVNR